MTTTVTTLERAFEIARSGKAANLNDIRKQLKRERFDSVDAHLSSPSLNRQLVELIRAAVPAG